MKQLEPFVVTQPLLNELNTLAAPSMLAAALHAAFAELGDAYPDTLDLYRYSAEFKEGAREGDTVQLALEETAGAPSENREFDIYFSKSEKLGRVGKWRLVFARRGDVHPLPYSLDQASADDRTDSQLWRPQLAVATGDLEKAKAAFREAQPVIDSSVTKGLIHRNKAARSKSRLSARIKALSLKAA